MAAHRKSSVPHFKAPHAPKAHHAPKAPKVKGIAGSTHARHASQVNKALRTAHMGRGIGSSAVGPSGVPTPRV